jgi:tRNA U54 and U55 pseudouridine synthase Pus10
MRFSSSGREDIDVRMLAEGRPFVLEVVDPHRTRFTTEQYAEMQREINSSTHLIRIRDLQPIGKYAADLSLLSLSLSFFVRVRVRWCVRVCVRV